MIVGIVAFWALMIATVARASGRAELRSRDAREWILDLVGLVVQGWVVPLAAAYLLAPLWRWVAPAWAGVIEAPAWATFLVGFVAVDYAYYWNHRLFHASARLWALHRVHHTLRALDVVGTSRNSLWTSFFIVYVWATSLATYLLADPSPYLWAVTATVALDLWRHSALQPPLSRWLGLVFVLPRDHAWHHAGDGHHGNYGANLILWDRLHGTRCAEVGAPPALGIPASGRMTDELFRPWALR